MRHEGPWRGVDDLELATLNWVHWFNETRLHSSIGDVPPNEYEREHYRQINPQPQRGRENPPSTEPGTVHGEVAQCDLWFPPVKMPVGSGQVRLRSTCRC